MLSLTLLTAFAVLAFLSVRRIPEGHAYTIHRFGRPVRTLSAGIHVVLPLIEKIAHKIRLFGNVVEFKRDDEAGGLVYFQVYWQAAMSRAMSPVVFCKSRPA